MREQVCSIYTVAALVRADVLRFVKQTQSLLGPGKLPGEAIREKEVSPFRFEDAYTYVRQLKFDWSGALTISYSGAGRSSVSIRLLRLPPPSEPGVGVSGELANYRSHEFHLVSELGAHDKGVLADFVLAASENLDAELGLVRESEIFQLPAHLPMGLESGIPDLYEVTVLGPRYSSLIGKQRILNAALLPTFTASCFARLTLAPSPNGDQLTQKSLNSAKHRLGEEFFAPVMGGTLRLPAGSIGLGKFLLEMFRAKREFESPTRSAAIRPKLDWSGVFAPPHSIAV